jgi:pimeloyl-ACP methyl ester carboxylesterase
MARYFAASLQAANKRKPVYDNPEKAIRARALGGNSPISHDAAAVLVERGLMPDHGGWTWRTDPQLFLPSPLRFTRQHALAFIEAIRSPACLVLANQGVIAKYPAVLEQVWQLEQIQVHAMDGGHHLHLEEQAPEVARILHTFFRELS